MRATKPRDRMDSGQITCGGPIRAEPRSNLRRDSLMAISGGFSFRHSIAGKKDGPTMFLEEVRRRLRGDARHCGAAGERD